MSQKLREEIETMGMTMALLDSDLLEAQRRIVNLEAELETVRKAHNSMWGDAEQLSAELTKERALGEEVMPNMDEVVRRLLEKIDKLEARNLIDGHYRLLTITPSKLRLLIEEREQLQAELTKEREARQNLIKKFKQETDAIIDHTNAQVETERFALNPIKEHFHRGRLAMARHLRVWINHFEEGNTE